MNQVEVIVVSVFGRGHWPAAELAERGLKTLLVDLSDRMGRWAPEDWEGPFGFFQAEHFVSSQVARLTEEDYHEVISDGFTVWPKEGPLDMRGRLASDWIERVPAYGMARQYVQKYSTLTADDREDAVDALILAGFELNWLAQLSHQLAAPIFQPNALSLNQGEPLPLWSPLAIRRITRRGLQKSLDWCRTRGVEVVTGAELVDVSLDGSELRAVEVGGELARAITTENVIWCLSSAETEFLSKKVSSQLFPKGVLHPEWSWMRWRIQGQLGLYSDVVPRHMVVIDDIGLPWTHGNLLIVQSCEVEGSFDVWARIPSHHRFQRGYCEELGQELVERLNRRLPSFKGSVQDQPQDYLYDATQLGPSLFPVFNAEAHAQWAPRKIKNIYFDGAEWLKNMDWSGRFNRQNQIVADLMKWKQVKMAKLAKMNKGGSSDRALHST